MFRKFYRTIAASPPRILVLGFAAIIFLGAGLLMLPFSHANGEAPRFIDALFTATSATCVTGLVVVDTGTYWTMAGQIIILSMIQIGGLGFMTMATLFAIFLKRRISLKERLVLQEAFNQTSIEGIIRLVRKVVIYALTIELVGAVLFSIRFMFDMPVGEAIYKGIFHAVSFFNNAGFDIMGDYRSLVDYVGDPLVNIVTMLLIILGGLGFVVLADLVDIRNPKRKLSLHSKVVLSMTGFLIVAGAVVILLFEFSNGRTMGPLNFGEKLLAAFMQSVSPRTAGVNTVDLAGLRQATQFVIVILMFIGASPGSTGGGIKTTTFTALVGAVIAMVRGKEDVVLFKYRLAQERVYKALTVTLFAFGLVILATMILSTTEDHHFLMILFEVTSAFGTVGLTMGLTTQLTLAGKIIIILMMFIGRLGPLTLTYALGPKQGRLMYRNAEGKIIIG
ncbi:TrkH family potassium uptake protein [Cohnella silvisoli]|uniref:TrkH family potassium uptake protein n=1 Tax=Cohnella silvisoli TaxID=2873699 RepID=A0ABV1KXA2_9BACL|nr:TrkH family potassium uptake protein [Cohnella silvisoli]MCD9023981.1 TrkH family potassium uptake protein [Cohnella silvisoli]